MDAKKKRGRSKPSLAEMPEVVMKKILEKSDYRSILTLRKVSHDLRSFIDEHKPEFHLDVFGIHFEPEKIKFFCHNQSVKKSSHIEYFKRENGCLMVATWRKWRKEYLLENQNYLTVFVRDFEIVLSHQNSSVLQSFNLTASSVPKELKTILASRKVPLKTRIFSMTTVGQDQIMDVLPFMDPDYCKELCFYREGETTAFSSRSVLSEASEFDKIVELEHWKKTSILEMICFLLDLSVQNFSHFESANYILKTISVEDLVFLKEQYLISKRLKRVSIQSPNEINGDYHKLRDIFGEPAFSSENHRFGSVTWYFLIPGTDQVLRLVIHHWKNIEFSMEKLETVPSNYVLL